MKRKYGTDVHPQWYSFTLTQTPADNAFATMSVTMPPGTGIQNGSKAMVMEILKIIINPETVPVTDNKHVDYFFSNKNFATTKPALLMGDATVFAYTSLHSRHITSGGSIIQLPLEIDCTDKCGNGLLYANQTMYVGINNVTGAALTASPVGAQVKILWRARHINTNELVGMVLQSNQN